MALFQQPARTPEEVERGRPLPLSPTEVADMDEATWYAKVYRGDELPQLTVRAVVMGSVLGFFMSFTNLYIGLKTSWMVGVAITAGILSFTIWNVLLRLRLARTPMSILENNCMQSTASAAGYSTGSIMISAIPAMLIMSATASNPGGQHMPVPLLLAWIFFIAVLGVAVAVPVKRNLINQERLRFPTGVAAAVTLRSLYSKGAEAAAQARALLWSALVAGLTPLLMDLNLRRTANGRAPLVPADSKVFDFLPGPGVDPKTGAAWKPSDWTMVLDHKLVMVAAGALVGPRVALSMLVGALVLALYVGPMGLASGAVTAPQSAWLELGMWVGVPMMVASSLLAFALQWRTIGRALGGFGRARRGPRSEYDELLARTEVPSSWTLVCLVLGGGGVITIAHFSFGIGWMLGIVAVALTFVLSLVAARATGETDITPLSAVGKITQLGYGALIPHNATANLMAASITGNGAASAADLLTDLKSGYLLGANPRRQFMAQFLGLFAGTAASVIGFRLLVPDATVLTGTATQTPAFPAPAAHSWLAVARVFETGFSHLHPTARTAILVGFAVGLAVEALDRLLPEKTRRFVPSANALGLGLILPFQYPLSMLIGALGAALWQRRSKENAERYLLPVSSGLIAGESIVGVVIAALNNFVIR